MDKILDFGASVRLLQGALSDWVNRLCEHWSRRDNIL